MYTLKKPKKYTFLGSLFQFVCNLNLNTKYHFGALERFVSGLGKSPSKAQLSAFGQGARH